MAGPSPSGKTVPLDRLRCPKPSWPNNVSDIPDIIGILNISNINRDIVSDIMG
jgi:hypothetical protein